jgi:hypothetical protein
VAGRWCARRGRVGRLVLENGATPTRERDDCRCGARLFIRARGSGLWRGTQLRQRATRISYSGGVASAYALPARPPPPACHGQVNSSASQTRARGGAGPLLAAAQNMCAPTCEDSIDSPPFAHSVPHRGQAAEPRGSSDDPLRGRPQPSGRAVLELRSCLRSRARLNLHGTGRSLLTRQLELYFR